VGALDTGLLEADGIRWRAFAHVDKYSPEQEAWAQRRFAQEVSWRGRGLAEAALENHVRRMRDAPLVIQGEDYRRYFADPEDGTAEAAGNALTLQGLVCITSLITGVAVANTKYPFIFAGAVVGEGSVSTAWANTDIHLGGDGSTSTANYQQIDAAFPTLTATYVPVITAQSTVASADGNFAWNEWCWATGTGAITKGATLASVYATGASAAMLNHKIASLGTKASGAAWVFTTTITIT
jgi:hypothetical protein